MFHHPDLAAYARNPLPPSVIAWRPRVLDKEEWRLLDYKTVYAWRLKKLAEFRSDPSGKLLAGAKAYYAKPEHFAEFIMDWMDTYDPRIKSGPKWVPFVFFAKQGDALTYLNSCWIDGENGIVEKCRDMGVTWEFCAWSVTAWLYVKDMAIGWGSRKEDLVDTSGIVDSLFEKMRLLISRLPDEFRPVGFDPKKHATFMRLINPENGATIGGESGDNIGRGGRKAIYFVDEAAHIERPEKIEASLGDNTNVRIDVSSVNGLANVFYRRAQAAQPWTLGATMEPGKTRKLILDWRDHPNKTQEWYDARKQRYISEGLEHIFAQEVDRNYAASVQNTVIDAEWIAAAVGADQKLAHLGDWSSGGDGAALDVADGGIDRNAFARRKGVVLKALKEWGARDVGVTTRSTFDELRAFPGIVCEYDCIGVGSGVKAEYNRICDILITPHIGKASENDEWKKFPKLVPWNAGAGVLDPYYHVIPNDDESPLNDDIFRNLKAQAWWSLRTRFWKTFQCIRDATIRYPIDQLISIDPTIPLLAQMLGELAQATRGQSASTLKMIINKQPDNTKSPNLADAIVMAYFPLPVDFAVAVMGSYGTN